MSVVIFNESCVYYHPEDDMLNKMHLERILKILKFQEECKEPVFDVDIYRYLGKRFTNDIARRVGDFSIEGSGIYYAWV